MSFRSEYNRGYEVGRQEADRGGPFIKGLLTGVAGSTAFALAVFLASKFEGDKPIDVSPYLNLLCEGSAVTRDIATLNLDLKEGTVVKIGDNEIKSLGEGEYTFKAETDDSDEAEAREIIPDGAIHLEKSGVQYTVKAQKGLNNGTELFISRGCPERG